MGLASIHPQPALAVANPRAQEQSSVTSSGIPSNDGVQSVYEDDSVGPLPVINVTRTLAAKLCGRVDDAAFNARIIRITQAVDPYLHVVASVFLASCLSLFFVADIAARTTLSYINGVTGVLVLVHGFASLSWDMLQLVFGTFEFWFLFVINTTNNVWFNMLFYDIRMFAMVVTGLSFVLSLCADANIYTRRFATRLLVIASPGLLFGLTATALHFPPDLHYQTFHVLDLRIDLVDLLVNGNMIISYFTAIRVVRSQHLVFSRGPTDRIVCDLYFPVCHLVPFARRRFTVRATAPLTLTPPLPEPKLLQHLELVHDTASSQGIDANDMLLPCVAARTARWLCGTRLHTVGAVGLASSVVAFLWRVREIASNTEHAVAFALAVVGLLASLVFAVVYVVHFQRTLARRVILEIDAWFVSLQLSLVTLGTCDALAWAPRRVPLVLVAWVWGHWLLFLDALPPVTRRRLGYAPRLTRAVALALLAYPIALGYWLYFSPARRSLVNRVLLDANVGGVAVHADVLGFLASKLFTLGAWMGRFAWREIERPRDAFKVIKHRVFYRVHV